MWHLQVRLAILLSSDDESLECPLLGVDSMCAQGVAMPFVELFSQSFAQVRHLVMPVEREYGAQYHGEGGASVPLVEVDVLNEACRHQSLRPFFPDIIQRLGQLVALPHIYYVIQIPHICIIYVFTV